MADLWLGDPGGVVLKTLATTVSGVLGRFRGGMGSFFPIMPPVHGIPDSPAIGAIVNRIDEINQISTAISAAVEEQSAATGEIARNVQQAAAGTQEISSAVTGVTRAAAETGQAAGEGLESAGMLSHQAVSLRSQVDRFLDGVPPPERAE